MNKKFLGKMKNNLLLQKKELIERSMTSIDIDSDGDETDEIQANVILELENQLESRNKIKLNDINNALKRIEACKYGQCEDCEEDISEKRLLVNPYFLICISCAELRETEEKQTKKEVIY
jgi:DnaK suppressor protein